MTMEKSILLPSNKRIYGVAETDLTHEFSEAISLPQYRSLAIENIRFDVEDDRTLEFPVSSNFPYKRWSYIEVLDHSKDAVDLSRFKDSAQLLFNHNANDYLGVILSARLENNRCYIKAKFDGFARAEQIYQSVKSGIIRNVSIGYEINELVLEIRNSEGLDTYKVTKWTPLEASFVTVPADPTVGVSRQYFSRQSANELTQIKEDEPMTKTISHDEILKQERDRAAGIRALCKNHNLAELADNFVDNGSSIELVRAMVLENIQTRSQAPIAKHVEPLGFDNKQKRSYSLCKAILYKMGQLPEKEAGLEIEASRAIEKQLGKPAQGIYVPTGDLGWAQRATYNTGVATTGGNTIETDLLAENFIEALRSQLVISKLGAWILSGLQGNVDIPRQASVANVSWIGEAATTVQSESTFDKITLRPKTVAARSIYTRNMLLQSSMDVELFIRQDLTKGIALAIDQAAINGTGVANQPLGIMNYPGVNAVIIGANGGVPTWATMVQMESEVALDNALNGTCHYLTNSKLRGKLKTTEKAASTGQFIWENDRDRGSMGSVNGYSTAVSNLVPGNLVKGTGTNLSAALFGDFSSLIMAEWGILDLLPNPYGVGYEEGNIQVRAMQTVDINLRRPDFFSVCSEFVTV